MAKQKDSKKVDIKGASPAKSNINGQATPPIFRVVGQYIKDLSFENPKAPDIFQIKDEEPKIELGVNVNITTLDQKSGIYECVLQINLNAKTDKNNYFLLEISYGGVFNVLNIPAQFLQQTLYVECPRYIFPYVRQIVTSLTQNGGYPPVNMAPIDFLALYQQNLARKAAASSPEQTEASAETKTTHS